MVLLTQNHFWILACQVQTWACLALSTGSRFCRHAQCKIMASWQHPQTAKESMGDCRDVLQCSMHSEAKNTAAEDSP